MNLDVSTYSLDDLYRLFHLIPGTELTNAQMKSAKRMALMSHPDKSHLDAKYFYFFSKAYKILYSLYNSSINSTTNTNTNYDNNINNESSHENKEYLSGFFKKNPQLRTDTAKFNTWFNREFVQCSDLLYDSEHGHGEWFKSNTDPHLQSVDKNNLQAYKNQLIESNINTNLQPLQSVNNNNSHSMVLGDPNDSSHSFVPGLFESNKCCGSDLKEAWSETVFAISDNMMNEHLHESVQSYKQSRDCMNIEPLKTQEQEMILIEHDKQNKLDGMSRALYYTKQNEKNNL